MEWRPIETAPKDGSRILLAVGRVVGAGAFGYCPPWGVPKRDGFYADGCDLPSGATHWMPLPAPPSSAKAAERDSSRDAY